MSKLTHKAISSFEGSNNIRQYNKGIINVDASSNATELDATRAFARTVDFTSDDIGFTTSTGGGGTSFDSPITSDKSGVNVNVNECQDQRSTNTDGDPTMLNGIPRAGNSAVDVIPTVSSSTRGLMTPNMLDSLNYHVTKIAQIINEDHSIVRNIFCKDSRDDVVNPNSLNAMMRVDFKSGSTIGLSGSYSGVLTFRPYASGSDWSGGPAHQLAFNNQNGIYHRYSTGDTSWSEWKKCWLAGDRITNAVWNDYAELFERGSKTEPGDLIAIDTTSSDEKYVLANENSSNKVVGVHSDEYGHLIGGENPKDGSDFLQYNLPRFIPVGLCGRVRTKVVGTCKKGDYLVASNVDGVARKYKTGVDDPLLVFGIACEDKTNDSIERIKVYLK